MPDPEPASVPSLSVDELPVPSAPERIELEESTLYLEAYFGDRPTGLIGQFRVRAGRLYSTPTELRALGIELDPNQAVDGDGLLALDTLPGLTYRYDIDAQRLFLSVPAALRPQQILGYRMPDPVAVTRDRGLLLNYDAFARKSDGADDSFAVATALRWFGRAGALETTGISRAGADATGYERLDTRWTYSDPERLWTWTAGDMISGALSWSRSVRLGGLQWRRNFGVRPDLITFPMPRFAGAAVVPSAVELWVNNIRQYGTDVDDGPFVIDTFPRISGAGEATLVVRDALGRTTQTTQSLYVDHERLASGLIDFSVEAGVLRSGFGGEDSSYGDEPVVSGSWRRGMTDDFTLETHAEVGPDLYLAGIGGVWSPAGRWGLAAASIARSSGATIGHQWTFGYQWTKSRIGFDVQSQRRSRGFRDIGDLASGAGVSVTAQDRGSFWLPLPRGSVAATWLRILQSDGNRDRIRSLSWTQMLGSQVSLTASVFDSDDSGRGAGLSFSLPLGRRTHAGVSFDHGNGGSQTSATLTRNPDYGGGWGWQVQAGDRQGGFAQASARFRGRLGEIWFGADRASDRTGYFFQGNGSLIWMGGRAFASRRINDAFAVVSSAGVAGVPILYENRLYGRTDAQGYLLLPDLRGWQRNRIAIDPDSLGANYRVPGLEQWAIPADNAAVLVRFPIVRLRPAMVGLLGPTGELAPAGSVGKIDSGGETFFVGFDGEAYLENLRAGTVLELDIGGRLCRYHVPTAVDDPADSDLVRLGPLKCEVEPR